MIEKVVGFGAELALGGFGDADVAEAGSGDEVESAGSEKTEVSNHSCGFFGPAFGLPEMLMLA